MGQKERGCGMSRRPRILVTGATGTIGSAVLRLVAQDPTLDVVAAARSGRVTAKPDVPTVYFDYDRPDTLRPALHGVDRVFMATGYTIAMFRQSRDFLAAARDADVEHIVHLGAPGGDDTPVEHWLWHQFIERFIEWHGFSFTHLRPDVFMQNLLGYGGARVVDHGVIRHYVANVGITWIDGQDVAAVAAAVLAKPEEHCERTYRIGSETKSFPEIARLMTDVVGRPFFYEARPADEFLATVLTAGADAAYMRSVYENYAAYTAGTRTGEEPVFDTVSAVLGRPAGTMGDFIRRHRESFAY
jgi:NAD(P)H dehydrogenase (quinone)